MDTAESGTTAYDTLQVQIRNSSGTALAPLATYSNANAATGFSQNPSASSPTRGRRFRSTCVAAEDSTVQTSFVVDGFALNVQ
jgi:hypothetical protein